MSGPLLIAFDGSPSAEHAIGSARAVSSATHAIVATVWESSMPALAVTGDAMGGIELPPDPRTVEALDRAATSHAEDIAAKGVALAAAAGFEARAHVVEDAANVAETLAELATAESAQAILVGSHGHGKLRRRVLGSTSESLLRHAPCPVIVVPPA